MKKRSSSLSFLTITLLASVLSVLFVFLGAPLLRVLRNVFGAKKYWVSGFVVGLLLWVSHLEVMGILLWSLWITVGFYSEAEERGWSNFLTAFVSILLGSSLLIFGPILWAQAKGVDLVALLSEQIQGALTANKAFLVGMDVKAETIMASVPSMIVIMMIMALAFALMLDRRTAKLFGLRFERISTHLRLLQFKVPDLLIWVTMISFLLSFFKLTPPLAATVALNIFNIMMGIYFFQGLAVMEFSFLVFRVSNFMKALIYLLIVGQLFFLLSAVGFIDYWVDFRRRLKTWGASERNQKNGEHV